MIQTNVQNATLNVQPSAKKYRYLFGELLDANIPAKEYLLKPYLQRVGLGVVAGRPDSGKSMLCRELAMRIAGGASQFISHELNPVHRRAIYITTEDPIEDTKFVLERQYQG